MRSSRLFLLPVVLLCAAINPVEAVLTTNSWTNSVSSKWETPGNWLLGVAPTNSHAAILITNATTKIVTIDATTAGTTTMTISNLVISSPNKLFLNNAGLVPPLRILKAFTMSIGTALTITNSALQVDGSSGVVLTLDGATFLQSGSIVATNSTSWIAENVPGSLTISNGTALFLDTYLALVQGGVGTLTVAGGTNQFFSFLDVANQLRATGTVWVTGGQLIITNNYTRVGDGGVGVMTVSNGSWQAREVVVGYGAGSRSTMTVAGGTNVFSSFLSVGALAGATGTVWMTDGLLVVTNSSAHVGESGVGQMTVSNGTWRARGVVVGYGAGSQGTMTIAGGTNVFSSFLSVGALAGATGTVWMTGGQLIVTNASIDVTERGVAQVTISNGTCLASSITLGDNSNAQGTLTVAGGSVTLTFGIGVGDGGTQTLWMTGGQLTATSGVTSIGYVDVGRMTVSNGTWRTRGVTLGTLPGSQGTLTIAGGVGSVYSNLTIGTFDCAATGTVNITGGQLRVTNNAANAVLEVRSGTLTQSGGTLDVDRLVITNDCAHIALTGGTLIYGLLTLSTNQYADADGDGMSNNYELDNGLDPLDPTDAGLDYDGDGQSNIEEFTMGTDPNDATSFLRITSIVVTNTTNILITWPIAPTSGNGLYLDYYVQWGTNLLTGVTNNLSFIAVGPGAPSQTNYLDVGGATNRPARFYRVKGFID